MGDCLCLYDISAFPETEKKKKKITCPIEYNYMYLKRFSKIYDFCSVHDVTTNSDLVQLSTVRKIELIKSGKYPLYNSQC